MGKLLCAFGRHVYNCNSMKMEFIDERPDYWLYHTRMTCIYCGKTQEDIIPIPIPPELRRESK